MKLHPHTLQARVLLPALSVAILAAAMPLASQCAVFPSKPVTIVVPFPAGGSSDVLARLLSLRLAQRWGQPVLVENRAGKGSITGTHTVAHAPADGYTLLAANASLALNEALSRRLPYHALRDFAPISLIARQPVVLVTHADTGITSVAQLRVAALDRPGQLQYASTGYGSIGHLAGELFKRAAGVNLKHVWHPGLRPVLKELETSQVAMAFVPLPVAMPHLNGGRLHALGVASSRRAEALPDVPAIAETFPDFEVDNWVGILAPYGVSVQRVRAIHAVAAAAVGGRDFKMLMASLGYEAVGSTPGQFQMRLIGDVERYARIASAVGIGTP